jgi:hypothetical protein
MCRYLQSKHHAAWLGRLACAGLCVDARPSLCHCPHQNAQIAPRDSAPEPEPRAGADQAADSRGRRHRARGHRPGPREPRATDGNEAAGGEGDAGGSGMETPGEEQGAGGARRRRPRRRGARGKGAGAPEAMGDGAPDDAQHTDNTDGVSAGPGEHGENDADDARPGADTTDGGAEEAEGGGGPKGRRRRRRGWGRRREGGDHGGTGDADAPRLPVPVGDAPTTANQDTQN